MNEHFLSLNNYDTYFYASWLIYFENRPQRNHFVLYMLSQEQLIRKYFFNLTNSGAILLWQNW
jgi:hypothetical protein